MNELTDYSGNFRPEFTSDTFSKDTLFALLKVYATHMIRMDGLWYGIVMSKWGNEPALDCDVENMKRARPLEIEAICRLMNIKGNDVSTMMKAIQLSPWVRTLDFEMDVKNNNHARYLVRNCPTCFTLEKEGKGRERTICLDVCMLGMRITADRFNPDIKITPLKVPPRGNKTEPCCHWEFTLNR
jgi:hypothetical protein